MTIQGADGAATDAVEEKAAAIQQGLAANGCLMTGGVLQELTPHDAGQAALIQARRQPVHFPLNPEVGGCSTGVLACGAEEQGVIGSSHPGFAPGNDSVGVVQGFATAAGAVPVPAHQTAGDHVHRRKARRDGMELKPEARLLGLGKRQAPLT